MLSISFSLNGFFAAFHPLSHPCASGKVLDPRGIRQMPALHPLGSLLAGINIHILNHITFDRKFQQDYIKKSPGYPWRFFLRISLEIFF